MTLQADTDEIRQIEAEAAPSRFARGWHCLGLTRALGDGRPHAIHAFGHKLVVFRGGDSEINVLDGYCRHMGGDLSQGEVKGNEIACPFRIEGATSDEWTDWHWYTTVVNSNCREIIDNVVDMAHFFYIHGSLPTYFKNIFEGHVATQYMNSSSRPDIGTPDGPRLLGTTSVASYFGPSFMIDDLTYNYQDGDQKTILINCHYPIDSNSFVLQYGIIVKKSEILPDDVATQTAISMGDFVKMGFEQDVAIWKNKARIDNPLLCEEDGPVYHLRRWYEQFYVDAADVAPDMVDRFEYELDTTHPREEWMKEVEANLAAMSVGPVG